MALLPETPVAETGGSVTQCIESAAVRLSLFGSRFLRTVFCGLCLKFGGSHRTTDFVTPGLVVSRISV